MLRSVVSLLDQLQASCCLLEYLCKSAHTVDHVCINTCGACQDLVLSLCLQTVCAASMQVSLQCGQHKAGCTCQEGPCRWVVHQQCGLRFRLVGHHHGRRHWLHQPDVSCCARSIPAKRMDHGEVGLGLLHHCSSRCFFYICQTRPCGYLLMTLYSYNIILHSCCR